jgi:hypothetical protein
METVTYQQLLAEVYEETAKDLLVHHNEYEDEEGVDENEEQDYEKHELPEQEGFKKFAGDRGTEDHINKSGNPFDDKSKISIRYDKDVKTHVINVDSRFRSFTGSTATNTYDESKSSNFVFRPARAYKNIVSIKLSSLEFPNVMYTFSASRENITIGISKPPGNPYVNFTISPGNYPDAATLATAVEDAIQVTYPTFSIVYEPITSKITISDANPFDMDFTPSTITLPFDNGLGHYLGFRNLEYTAGASSYTAESCPDIYGDTYIYLAVNDYSVIEHQDFNHTSFGALAKIQLNVPKNTMIFDQLNTTTKEYFFQQPTNISQLRVRLLDAYGRELDLLGMNFSVTLELKEVVNHALYEKMREL